MSKGKLECEFDRFAGSVANSDVFDEKTRAMLYLAVTITIGCYPWMEHYLGVARKEGLDDSEIDAIQAISMSMSACRVRSQLSEVKSRIKE